MFNKLLELKGMGVINITPNSFSDGGLHLNREKLENTISLFCQKKSFILDFGFESTAPINSAISIDEERKRFSYFLDVIRSSQFKIDWISFDTYKIDNFKYFFNETLKIFPDSNIILNDVSGVIDTELYDLFLQFKQFSNFYYLFSSTNVPERSLTTHHMNYVSKKDVCAQTYDQLKKFIQFSHQFPELRGRFFLDPAFGFSKSYNQNWELLSCLNEIIANLEKEFEPFPWVIGLSKKSFLRKKIEELKRAPEEIEDLHKKLISELRARSSSLLVFRVHNLDILI